MLFFFLLACGGMRCASIDGVNRARWHADRQEPWGVKWEPGDVIGFLADVDAGELAFSLNGAPLGAAFELNAAPPSRAVANRTSRKKKTLRRPRAHRAIAVALASAVPVLACGAARAKGFTEVERAHADAPWRRRVARPVGIAAGAVTLGTYALLASHLQRSQSLRLARLRSNERGGRLWLRRRSFTVAPNAPLLAVMPLCRCVCLSLSL